MDQFHASVGGDWGRVDLYARCKRSEPNHGFDCCEEPEAIAYFWPQSRGERSIGLHDRIGCRVGAVRHSESRTRTSDTGSLANQSHCGCFGRWTDANQDTTGQ